MASAEDVAEEIRSLGGTAVADSNSIATQAGAIAIVQSAIDAFGTIDILVNNAGITIAAGFDQMSDADNKRHVDVNLIGTMRMCAAAWPHMTGNGYGRIVNIGSGSFAGMWGLTSYGASKGGVFSLTRALADEGAPAGIKVNTVNPGAYTRSLFAQQNPESPMFEHAEKNMPAELVAPVVGYLSHESCPVSGECFDSMGGEVRRVYLAHTQGFIDQNMTIETVADRWREVMGNPADPIVPVAMVDTRSWSIRPYGGGR